MEAADAAEAALKWEQDLLPNPCQQVARDAVIESFSSSFIQGREFHLKSGRQKRDARNREALQATGYRRSLKCASQHTRTVAESALVRARAIVTLIDPCSDEQGLSSWPMLPENYKEF